MERDEHIGQDEMERLLRRTMRRTDILRAIIAGLLAAVCILVSAYVSLAAGMWTGMAAFIALMAFWNYSHKKRQRPITEEVTLPALSAAFEQPVRTLPGKLPEVEQQLLYPGGGSARCSDMVSANWQGMDFTFANVVMREKRQVRPAFHGQWLVIHTDWPKNGRVLIRERRENQNAAGEKRENDQVLPAVDNGFERMYEVDTDSPTMASRLLAGNLLRSLLMANEGTRLLVENGIVHLAIPSEQPFFQLTGVEETITQVQSETQRQISAIQAWLDGILAVEMQ